MNFFLLMSSLAFANPDFVSVEEGQVAPFSGKLLTEEALAEIIVQNEEEVAKCKIDSDYEIEKFKANSDLKYNLLEVRYDAEIEMYKRMLEVRDEQIKRDKKKDVLQRWGVYGAFILGVGTTVAITHTVNQTSK